MNPVVLDIIVLFGGVQALTLCIYLIYRRTDNKNASRFFLLFLSCIAFYNLGYAAFFMNLQIGEINFGMQPIPYKYLIAPAIYGYISFSISSGTVRKTLWLLMIPAMVYFLLRCYWLYMMITGKNPSIFYEVYGTGFFTINEVATLIFNLTIGLVVSKKIVARAKKLKHSENTKKTWSWLKSLLRSYIALTIIHLSLLAFSFLANGWQDPTFYYPILIINSLFIYWIGFIGFTKPNKLFFTPLLKEKSSGAGNSDIELSLRQILHEEKLFKDSKLTAQKLATLLDLPSLKLTKHIHDYHGVNFSQYINQIRTQEVIDLMGEGLSRKYSLEALAREAGFNSKSSFYKIFKEQTGKTPSVYLKSLMNKSNF